MRFTKQNIERAFDKFMQGGDSVADLKERIINLVDDTPEKVVVPKFVADWIESESEGDPIYDMCVNYETWGANGDDGTTGFTGELAEWFDDTLNVENYYRACIDGYEVEEEPLYEVVIAGQYLVNQFRGRTEHILVGKEELQCWGKSSYQLEEKTIKAIDERFWAFAVRAEEEE